MIESLSGGLESNKDSEGNCASCGSRLCFMKKCRDRVPVQALYPFLSLNVCFGYFKTDESLAIIEKQLSNPRTVE